MQEQTASTTDASSTIHVNDSIGTIIRKIPKNLLEPDTEKSMGYVYRDVLLTIAFVVAVIMADSWLLGIPLAFMLGTCFMSLFIIAHDCGHRSFSKSTKVCDTVGHITASFMLWPYHVWRLSHDIHHKGTHHAKKEIAWRPFTVEKYSKMPPFQKSFYKATRTWAMPLSAFVFTFFFFREGIKGHASKYWKKEEIKQIRFSIIVTVLATIFQVVGSIYVAGIYGFVCLFVIPQVVFQFWMSIYTYFHHTTPERTMMGEGEWTMGRGQLEGSIHVDYPKWVEWFHHDLNWHVPHHVCVAIPHYNLRPAHKALKEAYPEFVMESKLSWSLIRKATKTCQLVESKEAGNVGWVTFKEADQRIKVEAPMYVV